MSEKQVEMMVDSLLGERVPHLRDDVVRTISNRVLVRQPPRAVVMHLNTIRSNAWGTCPRFTTVGSVEVYA